jgi:PHD/YefM family antitoxin component YafN of YafNO toxin-antitoxin module
MSEQRETIKDVTANVLPANVTAFLEGVTPLTLVRVTLPSGKVAVVMTGEDFEAYVATSEILSHPERAERIKRALAEFGE